MVIEMDGLRFRSGMLACGEYQDLLQERKADHVENLVRGVGCGGDGYPRWIGFLDEERSLNCRGWFFLFVTSYRASDSGSVATGSFPRTVSLLPPRAGVQGAAG